jgi:hypothetical protein
LCSWLWRTSARDIATSVEQIDRTNRLNRRGISGQSVIDLDQSGGDQNGASIHEVACSKRWAKIQS